MRTSLVAEKASGQRLRQRLAQLRGFGWWKHCAWGAVAQRSTTRWPNLTLLTRQELRTRSSRPIISPARM
jgi:hypothetical protein